VWYFEIVTVIMFIGLLSSLILTHIENLVELNITIILFEII
jgi:hypothetical protein